MNRRIPFPLILLLPIVVITAWYSIGFHQLDEYAMVTEFAGVKLGLTQASTLSWEYPTQIRPWLQPAILVLLSRALHAVGVDDPFLWTFTFRLLHGLLGWLALFLLWKSLPRLGGSPAGAPRSAWLLGFAFFTPYLLVRPSSEMASASFLVLGAAVLFLAEKRGANDRGRLYPPWATLFSGALFGMAFLFRYQTAIAAIGLGAWLLFHAQHRARHFLLFSTGALAVAASGTLLDAWGYGTWTCAPWNYLYQNLVKGVAASMGVKPFWAYLYLPIRGVYAPLIFVVMAGAFLFWVRFPRHPLTWMMLPFFLMHSAIAHKEPRFVYPLAWFALATLALLLDPPALPTGAPATIRERLASACSRFADWMRGRLASPWMRAVLIFNLTGIVFFAFSPVRSEISLQRYLLREAQKNGGAFTAYVHGATPYENIGQGGMFFYRPRELHWIPIGNPADFLLLNAEAREPRYLLDDGHLRPVGRNEAERQVAARLVPVWRLFPEWIDRVNFGSWVDRTRHWTVWRLDPPTP